VLTNLDEGVKLVQIDLVASQRARTFSILTVVPGFRADYEASEVFRRTIYSPEQIVNYTNDAAFRAALETLPCCVTNKGGAKNGDPLNLVIVGGLDDAFPALVRRGWRPTEEKWWGSIWQMVTSALSGERYAAAPVSDLYLFGRAQDLALQKARDNIHQRNHLRLWLSPMRYHGKQVWVGQVSRDIGSRLTIHSPTLTTHKIDPDVDETREALRMLASARATSSHMGR
jgi:LssY C-terminus